MKHLLISLLVSGSLIGSINLLAADPSVRLLTLDPGHFHASLVQKFMYPGVDPVVHVYSPGGAELEDHLRRIEQFNTRSDSPTHWKEEVYTGQDFLERMLSDKAGNVVVISGNNKRKMEYIDRSVNAGLNVLADKPMAINPADFQSLLTTFDRAKENKVLLYDIMTERFEITSILQRELAGIPALFGKIEKGTAEQPAIEVESVHHFFKEVAGKPLIRPAWFFDVRQQGEAVPDVGTHLVDIVHWIAFPEKSLNWRKDVKVLNERRWATTLSKEQFAKATGLESYPDYLKQDVQPDGSLSVFANGAVTWQTRGVHFKVSPLWRFEAPPGTKDTHYAIVRGTKANLIIKQGAEQNYAPTLYVENKTSSSAAEFEKTLKAALQKINARWPGIAAEPAGAVWKIIIPEKYAVGHEAHFSQVTEHFLKYLREGSLPKWEVPNMLTKYYITTEAYRLSHAGTR